MASGLDLRKYQEGILAKLESVAASGSSASNSRLGVSVGKENILVNLSEISEVIPLPEMHVVPLTKPWFLGMANIRGNLYGINDLAMLAGHPPVARTNNSRVLLVNQDMMAQAGIVVERLIGLRSLDDLKVRESTHEKLFCFKQVEYEDADGVRWVELDCQALVESKDFMQPSI